MQVVRRLEAGDEAGALALADAFLAATPGDLEALHLKAMALGGLGRIDEAAPIFRDVARRHPMRHAVLSNHANALKDAGRLDEAIALYREAVAAEPRFANGWLNLGLASHAAKDADAAEAALTQAAALDPRLGAPPAALGAVSLERGDFETALAQLDRSLALRPRHAPTLVQRGRALNALGRLEESLATLEPLAAAPDASADALYQFANVLRSLGRLGDSEAAYRRALALAPARVEIHQDLARLRWERGEGLACLDDLDIALRDHPHTALLVLRSELALRAGDVGGAAASAEAALAADPRDAAALALLARAEAARGDDAAALAHAQAAHEADPDDFVIRHAFAERLLAARDFARARALVDGPAPRLHLQKQIGLRALALRGLGDPGYKRWYDYDRFTAQIDIAPPPGFASVADFNAALEAAIRPLHATSRQPIDQTLYGGTQSFGRLWTRPEPVFAAYRWAMLDAARRYVSALPEDPSHEFLARKSDTLVCVGAWSVILSSGGGHVDHIHPAGWISASYYVTAPEAVLGPGRDGHLRLGASGVAGLDFPAERHFAPRPGTAVFFPSYIWHGVETFSAATPRITAPFDLAPVGR